MADPIRISNLDEGTIARVAYDLMDTLKAPKEPSEQAHSYKKYLLDLYAECHQAARGHRTLS